MLQGIYFPDQDRDGWTEEFQEEWTHAMLEVIEIGLQNDAWPDVAQWATGALEIVSKVEKTHMYGPYGDDRVEVGEVWERLARLAEASGRALRS